MLGEVLETLPLVVSLDDFSVLRGTVKLPSIVLGDRPDPDSLAAWREVPHQTQLVWNRLAEEVEPHRPPFDHLAHITGQNLFVSAYHGFATLGSEHAPVPVPFEKFPPFAVSLGDAVKMNGSLVIPARFVLIDTETGYRSQYQEYAAPLNAL